MSVRDAVSCQADRAACALQRNRLASSDEPLCGLPTIFEHVRREYQQDLTKVARDALYIMAAAALAFVAEALATCVAALIAAKDDKVGDGWRCSVGYATRPGQVEYGPKWSTFGLKETVRWLLKPGLLL